MQLISAMRNTTASGRGAKCSWSRWIVWCRGKNLLALIEPHYPKSGSRGDSSISWTQCCTFTVLQRWYALNDPSAEEALYDAVSGALFCRDRGLDEVPAETTIRNFRHLLKRTIWRVSCSTASTRIWHARVSACAAGRSWTPRSSLRPVRPRTRKATQPVLLWDEGAHRGRRCVGLVHHVECTAANVADITQVHKLLHG